MLEKLYYGGEDNVWVELPAWASFFINLGSLTASSTKPGARLIVGLAIPSRAYAAALAAFGIVITRSVIPVDQVTPGEYFNKLCELEIGTAVFIRSGDRKLKGIITGCKEIQGENRLGIQVHDKSSGGGAYLIAARDSLRVEVAPTGQEKLPKKQTGKLVQPPGEFVEQFIGKGRAEMFSRQSRLECMLLGRINILKREIVNTELAVKTGEQQFAEGRLQSVLRARRFMREGEHFRSEITRVDGRKAPVGAGDAMPHVAIFDGATSFWKWRDYLRDSNWIIILDRTEPYFRNAAEVFNNEYMNRINDDCLEGIPPVPPGVEILTYYESK